MKHFVYADSDKYPIVLLVKHSAFNRDEIDRIYRDALVAQGVSEEDLLVISLPYNDKGKAPAGFIKEQLEILLPEVNSVGCKQIYCADANYFKVLTKARKAQPNLGYVLKCAIKDYDHIEVILGINHRSLLYNPANEPDLHLSIKTLSDAFQGTYQGLGIDIIKSASYPKGYDEVKLALEKLHQYPELSADIETFSLDFDKAGIGTIAFAWNQHEGIAFACDYVRYLTGQDKDGNFGYRKDNQAIKELLREFFLTYKGNLRWHGATFDLGILIYELWMDDLLDHAGSLEGLEVMTKKFDCTRIIAYLATNTTAGNSLKLKDLAHQFAGNWAQDDIKNILKISYSDLLEYNLVDCLSTNWVHDKYYPIMVADQQEELYLTMMKDSLKLIMSVELVGMPLDPVQVTVAKKQLQDIVAEHMAVFSGSQIITKFVDRLRSEAHVKKNEELKVKVKPIEDFDYIVFNPNSNPQLQKLLYQDMGLPVIDRTDTKQPATGGKTLKKLIHHTKDPEHIEIMEALIGYFTADKVLTSFIPAFERAIDKGDGVVWLHGSFNLGGTKSGRLSSSDPNMQNIPSGSVYGKLIKACFVAPRGWIFGGADFNSLEDYISALTTRDPNKLKVYEEGYDGHCLRAFAYFADEMPDIIDTVDSINSIADKYDKIRSKSKAPTFLLTYAGTYHGLVKNLGFSEEDAISIEENFHRLYAHSIEWVKKKLDIASNTGYVELAFGLRLRTPLLGSTLRGHRSTPREAEAEGRTAGNALGQSYGLLNNRAAIDFMNKVWASEYRLRIKCVGMIHDAIYLVWEDDVYVTEWVNKELIKSMQWQDLPELDHPTVKLGAALDIFWPSWKRAIGIANNATVDEIKATVSESRAKLAEEEAA